MAQGLVISDPDGRRILGTHFNSPSKASIAIDAALASEDPIVWVPGLDNIYSSGNVSVGNYDDIAEDEDDVQPWASTSKSTGGIAACQIERNGLRYITPIESDVDPIVPLAFLDQLHKVLEGHIGGPVTEASLKDHFDDVLALFEETMAAGRPLLSQGSQLRELVVPPSQMLAKVAANAASAAGLSISSQSNANALLASPLPWRRTAIKHASNEIYFDLLETVDVVLDKHGKIVTGSVRGQIDCRSRLSGMPDLLLTFADPTLLRDCAFHPSVRYGKWNKEKVVSFVPPDGAFTLQTYKMSHPGLAGSGARNASTHSLSALAILPFAITQNVTKGSVGGSFSITFTSRAPPLRPLKNICLRLPLGKGASAIAANTSGGSWPKNEEGHVVQGGAGTWDVETVIGDDQSSMLEWKITELTSTDRPAVLSGQYLSSSACGPPPAFTISFDSPQTGFSGIRIAGLKVQGESYNIYKGVRIQGKGRIEVRCI